MAARANEEAAEHSAGGGTRPTVPGQEVRAVAGRPGGRAGQYYQLPESALPPGTSGPRNLVYYCYYLLAGGGPAVGG